VEDYVQKIPDLLERLTERIRSLAVDKPAKVITMITAGIVAIVMVAVALVFLFVGLFRVLGDLVDDMKIAYAIVGGLFLIIGLLLWSRRTSETKEQT
jgi:hypothetical protein